LLRLVLSQILLFICCTQPLVVRLRKALMSLLLESGFAGSHCWGVEVIIYRCSKPRLHTGLAACRRWMCA